MITLKKFCYVSKYYVLEGSCLAGRGARAAGDAALPSVSEPRHCHGSGGCRAAVLLCGVGLEECAPEVVDAFADAQDGEEGGEEGEGLEKEVFAIDFQHFFSSVVFAQCGGDGEVSFLS